mmetsp:Transcript_99902/g.250469  ORF Transcript_99902/g.250469 Transcript_99902/m.250469 type:complete len:260 (+) Transcript_99902:244-1023(+)|eukprot:CAMPEP_0115276516 /NCGR_PEP_ID=MMETSP0270-20121206/56758_1 /TAXON_ID=71861 /ORGANISM="Scrippsiella trochoidea, Strain CCMP3099" /LENGTH=259 /DNA_ID=CAMNT_0002693115 /DNA_START=220 /DNA_END=999 /DNA_ORIENTATION=-
MQGSTHLTRSDRAHASQSDSIDRFLNTHLGRGRRACGSDLGQRVFIRRAALVRDFADGAGEFAGRAEKHQPWVPLPAHATGARAGDGAPAPQVVLVAEAKGAWPEAASARGARLRQAGQRGARPIEEVEQYLLLDLGNVLGARHGADPAHGPRRRCRLRAALVCPIGWLLRDVVPEVKTLSLLGQLQLHVRPASAGVPRTCRRCRAPDPRQCGDGHADCHSTCSCARAIRQDVAVALEGQNVRVEEPERHQLQQVAPRR